MHNADGAQSQDASSEVNGVEQTPVKSGETEQTDREDVVDGFRHKVGELLRWAEEEPPAGYRPNVGYASPCAAAECLSLSFLFRFFPPCLTSPLRLSPSLPLSLSPSLALSLLPPSPSPHALPPPMRAMPRRLWRQGGIDVAGGEGVWEAGLRELEEETGIAPRSVLRVGEVRRAHLSVRG
ncbi:unnamed protein product [Closterium sp. NIES-54]